MTTTSAVKALMGVGTPPAAALAITTQPLAAQQVYNTSTITTSGTLTAANITGGSREVALNMTGTLGAGATATFPTVAATITALQPVIPGQSWKLRFINTSSGNYDWTVAVGTGWTLAGTATISQNTWRDFYLTLTSATAGTIQAVGTGTTS